MNFLAELTAVLRALDAFGVDYALCGAAALAVHGVPRATQDIDLLARADRLEQVRRAVAACGFVLEALPMTFAASGITVHRFTKIVDAHPFMVDILEAEGPLQAVWDTRQRLPWSDGEVGVVSRQGLITMKLAAGRPQDIADLKRLEDLERG
ncbi:MAG TPA: hypothetical protein VJT73_20305 [Polyangiaceae bacterium]|nr:hypothetical protein [Polyangiaceae bacterium]